MITIERTTLRDDFVASLAAEASAAGLITMFDATSAANIPLTPGKVPPNTAIASYCDGNLPVAWLGCIQRFPELAKLERIVSIGSRAATIARICDMEPGNPLNATQVANWVKLMAQTMDTASHKIYRPGGYTDLSEMPGLQATLRATGLPRSKYSIWLARPGISVADAKVLLKTFDAVQIAFDHSYDVSLCNPDFFPPLKPKPPKRADKATGQVDINVSVNFKTGKWSAKKASSSNATAGKTQERWAAMLEVGNHDLKPHIRHLPFQHTKKGS